MRALAPTVVAATFVALGVLEVVFFASEDTYRADGTSNWAAYEEAQREVIVAVVLCVATAGLAVLAGFRGRGGWLVAACGLLAVTFMVVSFGATLN